MPEQWLTVAEAAAAMKVHSRTVERRIAAGKIDSRRNDDGQLEVLLDVPDVVRSPEPPPPPTIDPLETVREMADRQVDIAAGSASALVRVAQAQAMRAENQLLLARQDAGRYRREAQMALALVAVMVVLVIVAVAWGTAAITNAQANARSADRMAAVASETARTAERTLESTRDKLEKSVVARAEVEVELNRYHAQPAALRELPQPPTAPPPTNVLDRIATWFVGDRSH